MVNSEEVNLCELGFNKDLICRIYKRRNEIVIIYIVSKKRWNTRKHQHINHNITNVSLEVIVMSNTVSFFQSGIYFQLKNT